MKDTFTLADLANFKLEPPKAEPPPVAPAETQPAESSTAQAAPSDDPVVETSAETTPASTAGEADPAPSDDSPEASRDEKYIPKGRFDEVIDERNALRRFNEYLLAKEASPVLSATTKVETAAVEATPTLENSGFDVAKYEQSMKDWTAKQIAAARTQGAQQATEATAQATFNERMAAYAKTNPRVVTVLGNPNLPQLAKDAAAVVVESEFGPQILEHLGMNPDQAVRIARQTPAQQAAAIGRIEGELRAKAKPPQKTTPQITRAPNPPTPTSGRGNTPSVDPNKMSTKEWIAWDRQQETERRRARKGARSA